MSRIASPSPSLPPPPSLAPPPSPSLPTLPARSALGRFGGAGGRVVIASCLVVLGACGSRGPLDADPPLEAGTGADAATADAAQIIDAAPPEASVDAASSGGKVIECGTCLIGECSPAILKCVQTPACQRTLQCVVTTCVSGGAPDAACLFKCASGDVAGALQIFQIFQCVTGKCGEDCNPLLGGLFGGGGGGADAGRPRPDAGRGRAAAPDAPPIARAMYSRWPELASHVATSARTSDAP